MPPSSSRRWAPLGLWLLLTLSCSAPGPAPRLSAEEAFRKIEEQVFGARSLRVTFRIEGIPASGDAKTTALARGTLLLSEGNKAHLRNTHALGDERETSEAVSNGQRIQCSSGKLTSTPEDVSRFYEPRMRAALSRSSVFLSWSHNALPREALKRAGQDLAPQALFVLSNLRSGEDEGGLRTLLYTLTLTPPGTIPMEAKLWYTPGTLKAVKRTIDLDRDGVSVHLAESYEDLEFDLEIPEEEFRLPRDKH